jgi:hypothetical protein
VKHVAGVVAVSSELAGKGTWFLLTLNDKESTMKRLRMKLLLVVGLSAAAVYAGVGSAPAASALNVCPSGCAFTQIAAAVAAAKDGDSISVAPGTYAGGFTIDRSVRLAGAGPGRTIISGGGPVITVGRIFAASEPTVSIDGVTITGGVSRSSPESIPCKGKEGVWAAGGGIEVPPSTDFSGGGCNDLGGGATVTITDSVITGNEVAPNDSVPFDPCGGCPVAWARGGGIDTSGNLTLANTTVSDNLVGSAADPATTARFADGGGVFSGRGDMTISNSQISGNQVAISPHGVIADAGGIAFSVDTNGSPVAGGSFTMSNSSVTGNHATVTSDFGFGLVPSGGVHLKGGTQSVSVTNSTISDNVATITGSSGFTGADTGGFRADVCPPAPCTLANDTISGNSVHASTSSGFVEGRSGAGEFGGTITNLHITGNSVDVTNADGDATAIGGASVFDSGTITNSLISNNHVHATAPLGSVDVDGGAIIVFGATTLRNSTVNGTTVDASGARGSAFGGGVFDGPNANGPPGGPLVLQNSNLTGNLLNGGTGISLHGGGLYIESNPLTLTNSLLANNLPDQCFGC